jgi:hypothetical protein
MPLRIRETVCCAGLAVAISAPAIADLTIDQIIPENAVVVMGVHDVERSLERFRNTPMHSLLHAPEFREQRDHMTKEFMDGWAEFLAEMGVDDDLRAWPTGTVGMGMYPVMDPELGMPVLAMIAFAQFGEQMDGVMELVRKGIAKAEEDGAIKYEELDILGRAVHVLDFGAVAEAIEDEFDDDPFGMMMMMPDFSQLFDSFKRMYLVREGDGLLLGSDLGSLTESLERKDRNVAGLGSREEYRRVLDQLGTNDAFGMIMTRDLVQMISSADQTGMMMMAGSMASGIFGDIRSVGMSVRLDSPSAMLEQRLALYMPRGKGGLTRLFDVKEPREDLPRFTGPDSTMFLSMNFAFDRLADVIRDIIRSNPMLQMGAGEAFDQVEPTIREVAAMLGPRIYANNAMTRPIAMDSASMLMAIDCRDEQAFENFFSQHAPAMGFEPRDFLGRRIYTMSDDMGMMGMMMGMEAPSISVGIGGGYVFVGTTVGVEQSLRIVSQQDRLPSLADDPAYERAIAVLPQRPLMMWAYSDLATSMEASMKMSELNRREMMERMRQDFPDIAAEMEGEGRFGQGVDQIDWDLIRRHIGPSVSYVEPTDDGFLSVTYFLSAEQ